MIDNSYFARICCPQPRMHGYPWPLATPLATRWVRQLITQARIEKTFRRTKLMYKASRSAKLRMSSVEWWKTCRVFALWQACLLGGMLLLSGTGFAQLSTASLSGAARDSSGAVVPNCKVVLKNVATAVEHTTTTNAAGAYLFLNIIPGRYMVSVVAQGFAQRRVPWVALTGRQRP